MSFDDTEALKDQIDNLFARDIDDIKIDDHATYDNQQTIIKILREIK